MISDPAALAHARSGNDHDSGHMIQFLGIRRILGEPDVGPLQHVGAAVAMTHYRHRHFLRQWRIKEHVYRTQSSGFEKRIEIFEYRLGAFQRESGDQYIAACRHHLLDMTRQSLAALADQHEIAVPVTIGGFADDMVVSADLRGGAVDRSTGTDVTRKQQSLTGDIDFNRSGADDMSRVPEAKGDIIV